MSFRHIAFWSTRNPAFQQTSGGDKNGLLEKILLLIVGAILGGLLVPWLKQFFEKLWAAIQNKFSRKRKFQRDYLNWAIQSNKFISVLPSTMAGVKTGTLHLMELDEIYISLSVSRGVEVGKALSLSEAMKKNHIIIWGDPGAGKSTMMQYLTLQTASASAGKSHSKRKKNGSLTEVEQHTELNSKRSSVRVHFREPKRFPILIRLNKFHDIAHWPASKDLLAAIKGEIEANLAKAIPPKTFWRKNWSKENA